VDEHDIQVTVQPLGDQRSNRDPAARDAEHERPLPPVSLEALGQDRGGFFTVAESHRHLALANTELTIRPAKNIPAERPPETAVDRTTWALGLNESRETPQHYRGIRRC
jgi:hypothetical protein